MQAACRSMSPCRRQRNRLSATIRRKPSILTAPPFTRPRTWTPGKPTNLDTSLGTWDRRRRYRRRLNTTLGSGTRWRWPKALEAGRWLDSAAFDGLRTRFNDIHTWAVARFGENELLAAVRSLDPKTYPPPAIDPAAQSRPACTEPVSPVSCPPAPAVEQHLYPKDGEWRFTEKVPQSAIEKVNAIRDQAFSLGWSETRLYQNRGRFRFPCGEDYGLVCFVDAKERIGDVTRQYIEIIGPPPRENRLRFHNPDVDQPWLKKTNPET